jgi:hypothetical protein
MALPEALALAQRAVGLARGPLAALRTAMAGAARTTSTLGAVARGGAARGLEMARRGAMGVTTSMIGMGRATAAGITRLGSGIDGMVSSLGRFKGAAALAALAVIPLAGAGAKYLSDTLSFRENTEFAFKVLARSSTKAREMMTFSDELARSLGKSTVEVGGGVRELLAKGFDTDMIRKIVSGMADLSVINPEASTKLLTMAIGQVKSKGFLMMEELRGQIAEQGLDLQAVYKHIAQNLGIKQNEVEKAISGKKVTADVGITSILQAIQDMGGGGALGAVSAGKAVQTLGGAFDNARAMGERMLLAINTGPVGARLMALAHRLANLFDPTSASGQKLLAVLDRGSALMARMVGQFSVDDLSATFESMASAGRAVMTVLEPLGGGLFEGLKSASSVVREILAAQSGGAGPSRALADALRTVGAALGYVVVGTATAIGMFGWLVGTIVSAVLTVRDNARFVGRALAEGIGEGVDAAKAWLVGKLEALAALLPESVRKLLQIHSPSQVFADIGAQVTAGLTMGLDRGPEPQQRMVELVQPPPIPRPSAPVPQLGPRLPSAGAAGGRTVVVQVGGITIPVSGVQNIDQLLDQAEPTLRRKINALFEEAALQAGAPA